MAGSRRHVKQAEHNGSLATKLVSVSPIEYKDWAITIAFYAAIHYVEAYLAIGGVHSEKQVDGKTYKSGHDYRASNIDRILSSNAAESFLLLYRLSRMLRYLELHGQEVESGIGGSWIVDKDVALHVKSDLGSIKSDIERKIAAHGKK